MSKRWISKSALHCHSELHFVCNFKVEATRGSHGLRMQPRTATKSRQRRRTRPPSQLVSQKVRSKSSALAKRSLRCRASRTSPKLRGVIVRDWPDWPRRTYAVGRQPTAIGRSDEEPTAIGQGRGHWTNLAAIGHDPRPLDVKVIHWLRSRDVGQRLGQPARERRRPGARGFHGSGQRRPPARPRPRRR